MYAPENQWGWIFSTFMSDDKYRVVKVRMCFFYIYLIIWMRSERGGYHRELGD